MTGRARRQQRKRARKHVTLILPSGRYRLIKGKRYSYCNIQITIGGVPFPEIPSWVYHRYT